MNDELHGWLDGDLDGRDLDEATRILRLCREKAEGLGLERRGDAEMLDLRILEHLVDPVDRAAGHAGPGDGLDRLVGIARHQDHFHRRMPVEELFELREEESP